MPQKTLVRFASTESNSSFSWVCSARQGAGTWWPAETDNAVSVYALARLPELRAWLAAAGLSRDEAARIQPSYCYDYEADACFCSTEWSAGQVNPSGITGLAVGTIVALDDRAIRIRVDHIGGTLPGLAVGDERELVRGVAADARGALDVARQ